MELMKNKLYILLILIVLLKMILSIESSSTKGKLMEIKNEKFYKKISKATKLFSYKNQNDKKKATKPFDGRYDKVQKQLINGLWNRIGK